MYRNASVVAMLGMLALLMVPVNLPNGGWALAPDSHPAILIAAETSAAPSADTLRAATITPEATADATPPAIPPALSVTAPPRPLNVQVSLEDRRAVTATLTTEGGNVSVTAADGSQATLSLPSGSLLSEEDISLTPVTAMEGLPSGSKTVTSFQLAPEGLHLTRPATLTVELPAATDGRQVMIGLTYDENGREVHLYPLTVEGRRLVFQVIHFSGYGAALGDAGVMFDYTPGTVEAQAEADLAWVQAQCASGVHCDPNTDEMTRSAEAQIIKDWYSVGVAPQLSAAETDPDAWDDAAIAFIDWGMHVDSLHMQDVFGQLVEAGWASIAKGLRNAIDQAHRLCVANKDASQVQRILRMYAMGVALQVFGVGDADTMDKSEKCATFELVFTSAMDVQTKAGPMHSVVQATALLTLNSAFLYLSGEGPLAYTLVTWPQPKDCKFDSQPGPAVRLHVPYAALNLNRRKQTKTELMVIVDPEPPKTKITATCRGYAVVIPSGDQLWIAPWRILHKGEGARSQAGYVIKNWTIPGSFGAYATKDYNRKGPANVTETTHMILRHAPQP